jgi:protoporphyrinogen/coproporphyrinogen III oxidase
VSVLVLIIGGGITGLAAAWELARIGVPFRLLEASERAGGLILTEHVDGFTLEAGADSMLIQKPAALQLCDELGLGPQLISPTSSTAYVFADGRLHALPSPSVFGIPTTWSGLTTYDLLPWPARLRLGSGLVFQHFASSWSHRQAKLDASDASGGRQSTRPDPKRGGRADDGDESVASFYRRRFGAATVDLIAAPLLGGIHAGDVERLSMKAVAPRLVDAEGRHGSMLRAFRRSRPASGGEGLFKSLASGMGELVSAIQRRLPAESIRFGVDAKAISATQSGFQVQTGTDTLEADSVIVAIPAHRAAPLLAPVDPALADLCAEVPYVSTVSVALAWPRASVAHPLNGSGFVVARQHSTLRVTACTWASSKWRGRAPAHTILLRVFLGGASDPDAASLSDDELIEIAVRDISSVLGITDAPRLARVHRWMRAGAQHHVGHAARIARIEDRLAALDGLFVAGSGFRAIGIPDCVTDGRATAVEAARFVKMKSS